jgi:hypothetical protein
MLMVFPPDGLGMTFPLGLPLDPYGHASELQLDRAPQDFTPSMLISMLVGLSAHTLILVLVLALPTTSNRRDGDIIPFPDQHLPSGF